MPAMFDLFIPNPVAEVVIAPSESASGLAWQAVYGRHPRDVYELPVRLWLERSGELDLEKSSADCRYFVAELSSRGRLGPRDPVGSLQPIVRELLIADSEHGFRYGAPNELSRSTAPEHGCIRVVTTSDSRKEIVVLDLQGNAVERHLLPGDVPVLSIERWGWALLVAPLIDLVYVTWVPYAIIVRPSRPDLPPGLP